MAIGFWVPVDDLRHKPREGRAYKFGEKIAPQCLPSIWTLVDMWTALPTGWG